MDTAHEILSQWTLHLQGVLSDGGKAWSLGTKELQALCELVREMTTSVEPSSRGDMVRDSFLSGIREELSLYLGTLSNLERGLTLELKEMSSGVSVGGSAGGGALRQAILGVSMALPLDLEARVALSSQASTSWLLNRLHSWAVESIPAVRALVALIRAAEHQRGATLCSIAYAHCCQGDSRVQKSMIRVFAATSAPLHDALLSWVLHGTMPGGEVELCVELPSSSSVNEDGPWIAGPHLCPSRLPTYIPLSLAESAVRVGKAVRFLRDANDDGQWVREYIVPLGTAAGKSADKSGAPQRVGDAALAATGLPFLGSLVNSATALINFRLIEQLLGRHRALAHLQVVHRYVLLTQGDFVTVLLAGMGAELEAPAAGLVMKQHALVGILETAVRGSNAALEDRDLTDCLYVQFASAGPGAKGWDVFQLGYRVEAPLDSLITKRSLASYRLLFSFLWLVRRCEAALSALWNACKVASSSIEWLGHPGLARLLHAASLSRMRMSHFIGGLRSYLMLWVLAPAWAELEESIGESSDFDGVLKAHQQYLNTLRERVLFIGREKQDKEDEEERGASPTTRASLDGVLASILRFTQAVSDILEDIEPLANDARGMGIRARVDTHKKAASTEEENASAEVRTALIKQLDACVRKRGPDVKILSSAFTSQLGTLKKEFSALESRFEALGHFSEQ